MKKEQGQSLVEVILALGIAIVVIVALVRLTVVSIRNARFAKDQSLATEYAQELIEEVRKIRNEEGISFFDNEDSCDTTPETIGVFTRERECSLNGNLMDIIVTVEWSEGGDDKEVELTTVLTNWQ